MSDKLDSVFNKSFGDVPNVEKNDFCKNLSYSSEKVDDNGLSMSIANIRDHLVYKLGAVGSMNSFFDESKIKSKISRFIDAVTIDSGGVFNKTASIDSFRLPVMKGSDERSVIANDISEQLRTMIGVDVSSDVVRKAMEGEYEAMLAFDDAFSDVRASSGVDVRLKSFDDDQPGVVVFDGDGMGIDVHYDLGGQLYASLSRVYSDRSDPYAPVGTSVLMVESNVEMSSVGVVSRGDRVYGGEKLYSSIVPDSDSDFLNKIDLNHSFEFESSDLNEINFNSYSSSNKGSIGNRRLPFDGDFDDSEADISMASRQELQL